jgi:Mitochondrial protein Pet127
MSSLIFCQSWGTLATRSPLESLQFHYLAGINTKCSRFCFRAAPCIHQKLSRRCLCAHSHFIHCIILTVLQDLRKLAQQEERMFSGSTSSLTGILSHIYFLISANRHVDTNVLSRHFQREVRQSTLRAIQLAYAHSIPQPRNFTPGQRMPYSTLMKYKSGCYYFDSSSNIMQSKNVLMWMVSLLSRIVSPVIKAIDETGHAARKIPDDA